MNNLDLAIEAALHAGEEIMKVYNSEDFGIETKGDNSPLTKADKLSHEIIMNFLSKTEIPILSEEGKHLSYEERKNWKKLWIVDPIDGTNNYTGGRDSFSISLGLEYNNEIILGAVYLPKRDELFHAIKGNGAYLNEKPISVNNKENALESIITYSTYPGDEHKTESLNKKILDTFPKVKYFGFSDKKNLDETFGRGSMAAEFCYLACGRIDGLVRLKQKPWDVAGGSIIAKEAGAEMNNLQGKPCSVYEGDYVAANPKLLEKINNTING